MQLSYKVQQMIGYFEFIEPAIYAGLEQWYSISFLNSPVTVSSYPFIRFISDSTMEFALPIQCNSTTILPFNQTGLLFKVESNSSILVYNIQQIMPSGTYQMNCRMRTSATKLTSNISPQINI